MCWSSPQNGCSIIGKQFGEFRRINDSHSHAGGAQPARCPSPRYASALRACHVFSFVGVEEDVCVPAHRPIKPVYVRQFVALLDKAKEFQT